MANKLFSDLVTFSRGTGATRVNSAGLIVGVDFSATSNAITTGSKTFTLAADANVNRDWPVGSNVIAVSQAGATGSMTGVVTSYTPSTQSLVINVTSVTGSGTSTNWRIGSLDVREDYDPVTLVRRGVLSEGQGSNLFTFSNDVSNVVWARVGITTVTPTISPSGISDFWKVQEDNSTGRHLIGRVVSTTSGSPYVMSFYVSSAGKNFIRFFTNFAGNNSTAFDLTSGTITNNDNVGATTISLFSPGVYKISRQFISTGGNTFELCLRPNGGLDDNSEIYTGDGVSGIRVWGLNITQGSGDSHIPTTTTQVTRNADSFPLTAAALTSIRQGEGTLYAEIDCPDTGVAQKRALRLSGTNADIRIGKQGTGTLSNFTKMAEGGGVQLLGGATQTVQNNGLSYDLINPIDTRNNIATGTFVVNAIAYDGVSEFTGISGTQENKFNANISTVNGIGLGLNQFNGSHYNGSRFLISTGAAGVVCISTDGVSYRRVNTPVISIACNEITSGLVGGTLRNVIVGNAGFIATSDDNGETWTARTSGVATAFNAAAFGGGTFVAVNATAANSRASTDGISFSATVTGLTGNVTDIIYTGSQFVAINAAGGLFTSANGTTFTAATVTGISPAFSTATGIEYSNGFYAVVGNGGQIVIAQAAANATSFTFTTFLTAQTTASQILNEVFAFSGKFYAVGAGQAVIEFTQSLTPTFTSRTAGVVGSLNGIAASPTTLLITGANGAMASSTNGITFTSRTNNAVTLNGMAFGNNTFVSVGNAANGSGYIATIGADGTVTRRVSNRTTNLNNVRFLGAQFLATGLGSAISTSTDGLTWTSRATGSVDPFDVAYSGLLYVAVGAGGGQGRVSTSVDGATWSTATSFTGSGTQLNAIDFANSVFVLVGNSGVIATTTNGTTYTLRTSGTTQNLNSVMFSTRDQLWYAAGNAGTLLYSPDAITWTAVQNSGTASILGTTLQSNQPLPQFKTGVNKIGISYKSNQVISALNGITSSTDITASIPSITAGNIGENLNGYIRKIDIYTTALTAAEMSAKTL